MIESPELSGLLYKRRGGFGKIMPNAWQYRFFTLSKEGVLQYFDTEMPDTDALDSRARGRLDLKATTYDTTIESIEGAPTQFPIQIIIPNEETWKMCAYGKEDQQRWIKALEKFQHGPKGKPNNAITSYASDDELERTRKAAAESTRSPKPVATGPEPVIKPESKTPLTNKNADSAPVSQDPILDTKVRDLPPGTAQGAAVPAKSIVTRQRRNSVKKRLKLAGAKSLIEQETAEMSLVILILNVCFYGVLKNPFLLWKFFYVVVANFVIYHTLALRGARVSKAVNQKVEVAQVTVVDQKEHKSENSEKVISEQVVASSTTIVEQGVDDKGLDEDTEVTPVDQKPIPGEIMFKISLFVKLICTRLYIC
jgi:cell division septation protein DedD